MSVKLAVFFRLRHDGDVMRGNRTQSSHEIQTGIVRNAAAQHRSESKNANKTCLCFHAVTCLTRSLYMGGRQCHRETAGSRRTGRALDQGATNHEGLPQ